MDGPRGRENGSGDPSFSMESDSDVAVPRKQWDFFISYAREDRETAADPLAAALRSRGFAVWLDHDSLSVEARDDKGFAALHHEIEKGLTNCHAGIVIVSPHFIRKDWPTRELETLLSIETLDGRLRLVPVLHDIDASDLAGVVYDRLRARLTINTSAGFDRVCDEVLSALTESAKLGGRETGELGAADLPHFRGIIRCSNASCSWRVPEDWPADFGDPGPEFTLARVGSQWCIVCAACGQPAGSVTLEEAREIAASVQAGGLWGRTPPMKKETLK